MKRKPYLYETPEWKEMMAKLDAEAKAAGGGTGSNMAEPPYTPPEAKEIWEQASEEEKAELNALFPDK